MSRPFLFNPRRASPEELEATLVGRRDLLEKLQADLDADARGPSRRHWLIVAPRGTGKSHVTAMLGHRLEKTGGWSVAVLSEEQYQVAHLGDLLEQIVLRLVPGRSPLASTSDPDRLADQAEVWIRDHVRTTGRPLLVVVENLGQLLGRRLPSTREQAALRRLLSMDPPFCMVATATRLPDAVLRQSAPFYDFFQTIQMDDLTRDEARELLRERVAWDGEEDRISLPQMEARLDALFHFSGGNPRLILTLYSILRDGLNDDLVSQLLKLLDDLTPYYQQRLDDLSPQMQRVLVELAIAEGPITPAEVGRRCRMKTNQVTANLTKLADERFVRPGERPDGRSRRWETGDRFFRIWLQMREDRSAQRRLRFLAEFYRTWYAQDQREAESALDEVGQAFWRDLELGRIAGCRDHLLTADHMAEAVGAPSPSMAVLRALSEGPDTADLATISGERAQRMLDGLPSEHRLPLRAALATAALGRGDYEATIETLGPELDPAIVTLSYNALRPWLMAQYEHLGPVVALGEVDALVQRMPSDVAVLEEAAVLHAQNQDFALARELLMRAQSASHCARCSDRIAIRVVVAMGPGYCLREGQSIIERSNAAARSEPADWEWDVLRAALEVRQGVTPDRLTAVLAKGPRPLPLWAQFEAACLFTHTGAIDLAVEHLAALLEHGPPGDDSFFVPHLMECVIKSDDIPAGLVSWLKERAEPGLVAKWAGIRLNQLAKVSARGALMRFGTLHEAGVLPSDIPPFSIAWKVHRGDLDPADLHPEDREAVDMLLKGESSE